MERFLCFCCFAFCVIFLSPLITEAAGPTAVPTFQCLGLYWSPAEGGVDNECQVKYRIAGNSSWRTALSLWFDNRDGEYRGSIVELTPNTTYEIELNLLRTGTSASVTATTWSEQFPIAKRIYVTPASSSTLQISESGTPLGYVLYTPPTGTTSTIDVNNNEDMCINVQSNTSYIIIRGLVLKGARKHAINLNTGVHDIVIEENDISGWGDGGNYQSAVFAREGTDVERIIIQRNKMHHPRSSSNSWDVGHPAGPQAISLRNSKGNHVIRYNEAYSDDNHYFNDVFGSGSNFSFKGFPNRDSDIYGNHISHCWDDGIESEGANRNVRIWENYIDKTFVKIAIAATSVGPLYIWRNIANTSRKSSSESNSDKYGRGPFIKAGGFGSYNGGRIYVYHNTTLQADPPQGKTDHLGCDGGIIGSGGDVYEVISRNNILTSYKGRYCTTFRDNINSCTNDFNYDLYNGSIRNDCSSNPHQNNGIKLSGDNLPIFDSNNGSGEYALEHGTQGFDAGAIIPNFNDNYDGNAPDMGAFEANFPPMEFGVNAYKALTLNPPTNLRVVN
jgi:hypothetical protein